MRDNNRTVIFEESEYSFGQDFVRTEKPFIIRLAMKTNIFKNEKQAGITLLILVLLFILATIIIVKLSLFPNIPESVPYEDISFIEQTQLDPVFFDGLPRE